MAAPLPAPAPLAHVPPAAPGPASDRIMAAAGHQSLWLAATALLPLPPLGIRAAPAEPRSPPPTRAPRWSGDAWLLLRPNANTIAPGPRVGTYGASQVGAGLTFAGATGNSMGTISCNKIQTNGTGIQLADDDPMDAFVPSISGSNNAISGNGTGAENTTAPSAIVRPSPIQRVSGPARTVPSRPPVALSSLMQNS